MLIFSPKSRTAFNISKKVCASFGECAQFPPDHKKLHAKIHLRENKIKHKNNYVSERERAILINLSL